MTRKARTSPLARESFLATVLGTALLALSYIRILGDAGSAAFRTKIIDAALTGPVWGTALADNLTAFALVQVAVHVAFGLACLGLARLSRFAWPSSPNSTSKWLVLWFACGTGWLLIANAARFRWSSFGEPYADFVRAALHGFSLYSIATIGLSCALGWLAISAAKKWLAANRRPRAIVATASVVLVGIVALLAREPAVASKARTDKPHVIIIGLDSLRYDAVRTGPASITPAIDAFLEKSVVFTDATTPLARTFPAWVSLITGRHPHTTGAVMNLLPRESIRTGQTLPDLLHGVGYRSVYGIDEVRFSNLDLSYGFQQMIAPPIGATDFMLGFFGDTPLSNALVNTRLGATLYPYLHANRAASVTYEPDTFVRRLDRELAIDEPTLLAVHFTLAHWPYTWASAPLKDGADTGRTLYERAVERLDRQFAALIDTLQRQGVLQNAIVVVLSDHGESLGDPRQKRSVALPAGMPEYDEDHLVGHGTSAFGTHQFHVVLAVREFGATGLHAGPPRSIDVPVSLEDITPTLAHVFGIEPDTPFDGKSLLPLLENASAPPTFANRIRFTETEFNPSGIVPGQVMNASAMASAAGYYRVDPSTDRVLIRPERLDEILAKRQYAAFQDGSMVVAVPPSGPDGTLYRKFFVARNAAPIEITEENTATQPAISLVLAAALRERFPDLKPRTSHE